MNTRIVAMAFLGAVIAVPAVQAQAAKPAVTKVKETEKGLLAKARIKPDSAMALARKAVPGATIEAAEIENEKGTLLYSFDMKTAGADGIDEVTVDAKTGAVKKVHESSADEAKEAAADAKKAAAKKPPVKKP